jgi:hypothetical protein
MVVIVSFQASINRSVVGLGASGTLQTWFKWPETRHRMLVLCSNVAAQAQGGFPREASCAGPTNVYRWSVAAGPASQPHQL